MSDPPDRAQVAAHSRHVRRALAVGVALRLLWAAWLAGVNDPVSDCSVYLAGALGLARGEGFVFASGEPNGFWPVGYSALLAPFHAAFGAHPAVAYAVNVALGAALVLLAARLARRLYGPAAGSAAAWVAALYPSFVLYPTVIASENLYLPLLVAFGLATLSLGPAGAGGTRRGALGAVAAAGLLLGALVLVRPTALALPLLVPLGARLAGTSWLGGAARAVAVTAIAVLLGVPWGVRNERVFGEFTLSSFNGGPVLWMGNHDGEPTTDIPERFAALDVVARHHAMKDEAVAYIKARPDVFARRVVTRSVTALASETIAVVWNEPGIEARLGRGALTPLKLVTSAGWWLLLGAFLVGLAVRLRARAAAGGGLLREGWQLAGVAAGAAPFLLFDSQNRYHFPLIPFLMPLAALALARGVAALRRARPPGDALSARAGAP